MEESLARLPSATRRYVRWSPRRLVKMLPVAQAMARNHTDKDLKSRRNQRLELVIRSPIFRLSICKAPPSALRICLVETRFCYSGIPAALSVDKWQTTSRGGKTSRQRGRRDLCSLHQVMQLPLKTRAGPSSQDF